MLIVMPNLFPTTFSVAISSDEAPEWIELIPAGRFSAVDGRGPFENSDPDAIVAASVARMPQVGLVLDYDHSTDLAAPEGRPAPAAGWLKQFRVERGAIFARIEWTADAAEAVKAKKYRYISPVFEHSKDGKVERILRAALTNNPALVNLTAISSASLVLSGDDRLESLPHLGESDSKVLMAEYAYTDSDGSGHLPIHDAAHVRNALARFGQTYFESRAKAETAWSHIKAAAKKFGIESEASMPTPKIKEPSGGYKKASATMAGKDGDGKTGKLSERMGRLAGKLAKLEADHPEASEEQLMTAARALMGDDLSFEDWARQEQEEHDDGGEPESEEQMARRQADEMARCSTDGERADMAARHAKEKEEMAKRTAPPYQAAANMSELVAKHPMVIAMANEITTMRQAQLKAMATERVAAAIRDGRLLPVQREWAIAYCAGDAGGFEKFLSAQPKILQTGNDGTFTARIGEPPKDASSLSEREIEIFANLGLETKEQLEKCAAVKEKWTLRFPRPRLLLDDSNSGMPETK